MIHRQHTAARPDGTVIVSSDSGSVEADTHQCVHCGAQWTVQHGSGNRRNFCTYHMGRLCGAPECDVCLGLDHGKQHGEQGQTDHNMSYQEKYKKHHRKESLNALYVNTTKGGIIIP